MITLTRDVYDAIIDHAIEGRPEEVCGLLGGRYDDEVSNATLTTPAENTAATPEYEYAIDPEEQFALTEEIEAHNESVVGFYHSHPAGPPGPSETDAARATWPGLSYVIVVLQATHPYIGSWRWNQDQGRFEQEIVRLTHG